MKKQELKNKHLIIGSRSSKLALTQTEFVKGKLKQAYPALEIKIKTIKTTGDKILDAPLDKIGDKGLFTKEIEEALLKDEVDLAVHSMKDLPCQVPRGLKITAIMKREDPRDILVCRKEFSLRTLPKNSRVGTSSLRRRAQVLNIRDDLEILNLRGNLDTRIKKLDNGLYDAIILAYAGVKRLGLKINMSVIPIDNILPQAGQGALGIEVRRDDLDTEKRVKLLDDSDTHIAVTAERASLSELGGGCQVPIGVYARLENNMVIIKAGVFSLDGKTAIKDEIIGDRKDADVIGKRLAQKLLKKGAKQILEDIFNPEG